MFEINMYRGGEILEQLNQQLELTTEQRPLLGLITNDVHSPESTGGVEYLRARLESAAFEENTEGIPHVDAVFSLLQGEQVVEVIAATYPKSQIDPSARYIRRLDVYSKY